jgi:adenine/guanine/hypoxanthine permease
MSFLNRYFEMDRRGTNVSTELRGAITTFLTMAYILAANPMILKGAGVPFGSAVACTALAAGVCCIMMGLIANFPLALASGMGLNAVVAYQVASATGSWQTAMGLVVLDGLVVFLLVLFGFREWVMRAIPRDLRLATGAGIGLFIAFLGAVNARLVVVPAGTLSVLAANPLATMPPVTYGILASKDTALALVGLFITAFLMARRIRGAILLGIVITTILGLAIGVSHLPDGFSLPTFGSAFHADVLGAMKLAFVPLLITLVMVDFFDTLGTATAIAEQGELHDKQGNIFSLRRILYVDALSASIGGILGASSVTSYVESAAGVAEGARTGLSSVFVGILFLLSIFVAPYVSMVPMAATSPALILIGFLMCSQIIRIDFEKLETSIPAFITFIMIPLTYSISHGIGYGFITFVVIKVLSRKWREVHPLMYGVSAAFAAYFILVRS